MYREEPTMNTRFLMVGALILLSSTTTQAQNQLPTIPSDLSLEFAINTAERYSPTYRQTLNDRGPAAWNVRNAFATTFLPRLDVNGSASYRGAGSQRFLVQTFTQPSATIGSSYGVNLNWTVDGSSFMQPGVQRAALSATDASIDAARMNLRSSIVSQYVTVLQAEAQVLLQQRQVERNEENRRLSQARFDVGQTTMLDVRQAQVAKGQSDVGLLQARQSVTVEKLRLFQVMGVEAPEDLSSVILTDSFPVVEPTWNLADLLADADGSNPNVNALRARESSAEWSERSIKSQWLPQISMSAGWSGFTEQFTNGDFLIPKEEASLAGGLQACNITNTIHADVNTRISDPSSELDTFPCDQIFTLTADDRQEILDGNSVFPFTFAKNPFQARLTVSLPIFDQFSRNLQISQASTRAEDAQELRRDQELQVRTNVSQQFYALMAAYETIGIQENNRTAAEDGLRLARERYRVGSGPFMELLDAQITSQQAQADYITGLFDYQRALVNLEAIVGRTLR